MVWCLVPPPLKQAIRDSIIDDSHTVGKLILDQNWNFVDINPPLSDFVKDRIRRCHIPHDLCSNKIRWNTSSSGDLSLKQAYDFKRVKIFEIN